MPKYVALLRAINVGGHTVKMDRLRRLFEELGFKNVETFIASGNVIRLSVKNSPGPREAHRATSAPGPGLRGRDVSPISS